MASGDTAGYHKGAIVGAGCSGDVKSIERCIALGAQVDEEGGHAWTALTWAASQGHKSAVEMLISLKANVNHKSNDGDCPLYKAAYGGHKGVCELLVKAGADKTVKCPVKTPAQIAVERGHKDVAALLS